MIFVVFVFCLFVINEYIRLSVLDSLYCVAMWKPLLALALLLALCDAAVITGRTLITIQDTNITSGVPSSFDATELSFVCTATDTVLSVQIGNYFYVANCFPPVYTFTTIAKGYIPTDSGIVIVPACQVDNAADVNDTNQIFIPSGTTSVPAGRRLMEVAEEALERYLEFLGKGNGGRNVVTFSGPSKKRSPSRKGSSRQGRSLLSITASSAWECEFSGLDFGLTNCDGYNDLSVDITALQSSMVVQQQEMAQQQTWDNNATALFAGQAKLNSRLQTTVSQQNQTLYLMQAQITTLQGSVAAEAAAATKLAAQQQADMIYIYQQTAAGLAAVEAEDTSQIALLQNKFVNITQQIVQQINLLVASINSQNTQNTQSMHTLLRQIDLVQTNFLNSLAGTNTFINTALLAELWIALEAVANSGLVAILDPNYPGTAPASTITDSDVTAYVDIQQINYVNSSEAVGGVVQLHSWNSGFYCNLAAMIRMNLGLTQMTWQRVNDLIGPTNCTLGYTSSENPVVGCKCWFQITHQYCTRAGNSFVWEDITSVSNRDAYDLTPNLCEGNAEPTTDPNWNGRFVDSFEGMTEIFGAIISSQSLAADSGFNVISLRYGPRMNIPANYSSQVTGFDMTELFVTGVTINVPYTLYNQWITAIPSMITERNLLNSLTNGVWPRGLTTQFEPFTVLSNAQAYTCFSTGIAVSSPGTVIVYEVQPTGYTQEIEIKAYDQPPDCISSPGICIPLGDLVAIEIAQTTTLTPPADGILPTSETIIIGDWTPTGMSQIYDIPQRSLSLAPDEQSQRGLVTYLLWGFDEGYSVATNSQNPPPGTLNQWEDGHPGDTFDHFAPTSAGYYRRAVSQGQVILGAGQGLNEVGATFNAMAVDTGTNMRQGVLGLSPYSWQTSVTMQTVTGPLTVLAESGCPQISYNPDSLYGRIVTLTNSWGFEIIVAVVITNTNPSCPQIQNTLVTMMAAAAPFYVLEDCGNYTFQVFSVAADVFQTRTACAAALDVIFSEAISNTQSNIVISTLVNQTTLQVTDQLIQNVAATSLTILNLINAVITTLIPNITVDYGSIIVPQTNTTVDQIIAALKAAELGIDYTSNSANDVLAPYLAQFAAENNATRASLALQSQDVAAVKVQTAVVNQLYLDLVATNNESQKVTAAGIAQLSVDIANLRNIMPSTSSICTSGAFTDMILCTLYLVFEVMIWVVVGGAVVWLVFKLYQCIQTDRTSNKKSKSQGATTGQALPRSKKAKAKAKRPDGVYTSV